MPPAQLIRMGDSLEITYALADGKDIAGYVCTMYVKQHMKNANAITQIVPPNPNGDQNWLGKLTASQTALLGTGLWYAFAIMKNGTTDESETEFSSKVRFEIGSDVSASSVVASSFLLLDTGEDFLLLDQGLDKLLII